MSRCPTEETLLALMSGALRVDEISRVQAHAATCEKCAAILADFARGPTLSNAIASAGGDAGHDAQAEHLPRIGRYELSSLLGTGGMGVVFEGFDPQLERRVAIKILRMGDGAIANERRVLREARAMARLAHPNVVHVYEVGQSEGRVFIVMELVLGSTLTRWLAESKRSVGAIVDVFLQAGRGLAAAHENGIVHRDFKPDNVLVSRSGEVRVTDFGLAQGHGGDVGAAEGDARSIARGGLLRTRAGAIAGTPAYMAPEQLRGEPADFRSDVFGFCAALFEALHEIRPFAGDTPNGILEAIARGTIEAPRRSDVPDALRAAIVRGLAADPEARPATMNELLVAIAAAAHRPIAKRRSRWGAIAAIVAIGLGVSAFAIGARAKWIGDVAPPPPPVSTVPPEANAKYRACAQWIRDASLSAATRACADAVKLAPELVQARVDMLPYADPNFGEGFRSQYSLAVANRSGLDADGQAFLKALEPLSLVPPDADEANLRLETLAAARADDALFQASVARFATDDAKALAAADRAIAKDPALPVAWLARAMALTGLGRNDEAMRALDACIERSPAPTSCLDVRAELFEKRGRADDAERDTRRAMAIDPADATTYMNLANILASRDEPDAVKEALTAYGKSKPGGDPEGRMVKAFAYPLALLTGDFEAARRVLAEADTQPIADTYTLVLSRVLLDFELGEPARARADADAALATAAVHPQGTLPLFEILQIGVDYKSGGPRSAFLARRDAWMTRLKSDAAPGLEWDTLTWLLAYELPARTPRDAIDALASLPRASWERQASSFMAQTIGDYTTRGMLHHLAGDLPSALADLAQAANDCTVLGDVHWSTRAQLEYGLALEESGRNDEACVHYARVVKRWGNEPRSVSAAKARSHAAKLGCASAKR